MYALYGPAVYAETVVLSEGLLLLLLCVALWALARDRVDGTMAAIAGASLAAASLVRPTALVMAGACLCWLLLTRNRDASPERRNVISFVVATVLVLLPALARNYSVSRTLSIQGYGGLNVYIGDSPLHDGRATFRLGAGWDALNSEAMRAGIADPAAQDRYYLTKTASEIGAHPGAFIALIARKAVWMVQAEESRDSHSYYFFIEQSLLLRVPPRFAVVFPLACVGLFVIARSKSSRSGVLLLMLYMLAACATVLFLVVGLRYRLPLVPGLAIFAGLGGDAVIGALRLRRTRELAAFATVCFAAVVLSRLLHDPANTNVAEEYAFTGSSLITEHNLQDAEAAYRHAIALDPRSGLAWDGLGLALYDAGRLSEARASLDRAIAIDLDNSRAVFHLALVDEREGKMGRAAEGYERARSLSPYDTDVASHLANALRTHATELGMAGRTREARDEMRRAVTAAPSDGEAWLDLCLLSLDAGDRAEADTALQRAKNLGADPARLAFAEEALRRAR